MTAIGFIGCGTITSEILTAIDDGTVEAASVAGVCSRSPDAARESLDSLGLDDAPLFESVGDLTDASDLVVEAASQEAVHQYASDVLAADTDLLLLSVGALADENLRSDVFSAVDDGAASLYVPSGAIAGLDAVKAAAVRGGIDEASLTTRKPPAGLAGAPYVTENDIDLDGIDEPTRIFEGDAATAASAFPSNINVAMALSLAGIGPEETTVRIVADPDEENNVHHIEASGDAGTLTTEVRNVPSPTNPKTSYLASLSAIGALRRITGRVEVGT